MDKDEINRSIDARINKKVAFIKALKPLETDELWAEVIGAKDAFGNHTKVRNLTIDWLMSNADAFDAALFDYVYGIYLQAKCNVKRRNKLEHILELRHPRAFPLFQHKECAEIDIKNLDCVLNQQQKD